MNVILIFLGNLKLGDKQLFFLSLKVTNNCCLTPLPGASTPKQETDFAFLLSLLKPNRFYSLKWRVPIHCLPLPPPTASASRRRSRGRRWPCAARCSSSTPAIPTCASKLLATSGASRRRHNVVGASYPRLSVHSFPCSESTRPSHTNPLSSPCSTSPSKTKSTVHLSPFFLPSVNF